MQNMDTNNLLQGNKRQYWKIGAIIVAFFIVGFIIGYYARSGPTNSHYAEDLWDSNQRLVDQAMNDVNPDSLRNFLKELSKEPHLAGLERDKQLTKWIKDKFEEFGLDDVELNTYEFLLSFPNSSNPNKIYLLDPSNKIVFTSRHEEDPIRPEDIHENFVHAFNAYAPAGEVEGDIVYVNYARVEDMDYLRDIGVNVTGKIAMARYGKIFRGNKLDNVQRYGAAGLIIFSDPADAAPKGTKPQDVYPNSIFLPPTGIQRGTVFLGNGDPLTPTWPSVPNSYRITRNESNDLPTIPCQPIGYQDAKVLLEKLGGKEVPADWKGGMKDIKYRFGGTMSSEFEGYKVKLSVHNYERDVKSSNVIGYLKGSVEPDRYIFLSNHRDAWGYGSIDPSSGTTTLLETARILGKMHKSGWTPRRTIIFCSWAAEEYGLLGSEEFVQHKVDKLMARGVAVVNNDLCPSGPIPDMSSSPSLREMLTKALKRIDHWNDQGSLWDEWKKWKNQDVPEHEWKEPKIEIPGFGSDHTDFIYYAGVPAVDYSFTVDKKKDNVSYYPAYHTGYETFYLVDKLSDPGFKISKACSQLSIHMILHLSESLLLPFNFNDVADAMEENFNKILHGNSSVILERYGLSLEYISSAIQEFKSSAKDFTRHVSDLDTTSDPLTLKMVNDQILMLERVFLLPQGLPLGRTKSRHAIFSPAKFNGYGGAAFPGIDDLLYGIERLDGDELEERIRILKKHLSDLMIVIQNAASFLKPTDVI